MSSSKLTAIILAKNEEHTIQACIESLSFANEVLVIDDKSTDATKKIATKLGAKVIEKTLDGDFAGSRNFAMEKAKNDWLLYIDSDEIVSPELGREIEQVLENPKYDGYLLRRRDFFHGHELKYGETQTVRNSGLMRLIKKDSGKWSGTVHEKFGLRGNSARLHHFIDHHPHATVKDFIDTVNRYSSIRAQELMRHGNKPSLFELITFPFGKFVYTYFLKAGFMDGYAGFVYAFMMSFHSFLVRAKLYQYVEIDQS